MSTPLLHTWSTGTDVLAQLPSRIQQALPDEASLGFVVATSRL